MNNAVRAQEPYSFKYYLTIFFFMFLVSLGNYMLLSLFTAILLEAFDGDDEE